MIKLTLFKEAKTFGLAVVVCCMLLSAGILNAQPLTPGMKIPDLVLTDVYNYHEKTISIHDLKGKFVILDFWDRYCKSCLYNLAKLDSLLPVFKDELVVLPVTTHSAAEVEDVWKKSPLLRSLDLPTVVNDTVLHNLFPHNILPYLVWIDPSGKILYTTNSAYITSEYITALIKREATDWRNISTVTAYDFSAPLFPVDKNRDAKFSRYSVVGPFRPGLKNGFDIVVDSASRMLRISCVNLSVKALYLVTLETRLDLRKIHRQQIEVRNPDLLTFNKRWGNINDWDAAHRFCYEFVAPLEESGIDKALGMMRNDLNNWFPYIGEIRKTLRTDGFSDYFVLKDKP